MIKLLKSSANPTKLSLTIKGIIIALFGVAAAFGVGVGTAEGNELADAVDIFIKAFFGVISSAMIISGILRKIWFVFNKKK